MSREQDYLHDVIQLLVEEALTAKRSSKLKVEGVSSEERAFEEGRALAYYEVISTLINQAKAFGISPEIVPALQFDPDKELLAR